MSWKTLSFRMSSARNGPSLKAKLIICWLILFNFNILVEGMPSKSPILKTSSSQHRKLSNPDVCSTDEFFHPVHRTCISCQSFWGNHETFSSNDKKFYKDMCGCHPVLQFPHPVTEVCEQCSDLCNSKNNFCQRNCEGYLKYISLLKKKQIENSFSTDSYSTEPHIPESNRPVEITVIVCIVFGVLLVVLVIFCIAYTLLLRKRHSQDKTKTGLMQPVVKDNRNSEEKLDISVVEEDEEALLSLSSVLDKVEIKSSLHPSSMQPVEQLNSLRTNTADKDTEKKSDNTGVKTVAFDPSHESSKLTLA